MIDWITIPPDAFIESHRRKVAGAQFFRSPFDVPSAVRAKFDATSHVISIELRYIGDDEPRERFFVTERVWCEIGRRSKRLFVVHINASGVQKPEELSGLIHDAAEEMRRRSEALSAENTDATAEALETKRPQIMQQLALGCA